MVRFINGVTGGVMWVHESRVEEYKRAGHIPAPPPSPPEEKPRTKRKSTAKKA